MELWYLVHPLPPFTTFTLCSVIPPGFFVLSVLNSLPFPISSGSNKTDIKILMLFTTIENMFTFHLPILGSWLPAEYIFLKRKFLKQFKAESKKGYESTCARVKNNLCEQVSGEVQLLSTPDCIFNTFPQVPTWRISTQDWFPSLAQRRTLILASYLLLQTPGPSCQLAPGILFPVQLFWVVNHSMNVTLLLAEIHPLREHFCAGGCCLPWAWLPSGWRSMWRWGVQRRIELSALQLLPLSPGMLLRCLLKPEAFPRYHWTCSDLGGHWTLAWMEQMFSLL